MKVFITGATGFVGRILVARLLGQGHQVRAWCRSPSRAQDILGADAEIVSSQTGATLADGLRGCDAVVNLQGENVFGRRWNSAHKGRLVASRVDFTQELVATIESLGAEAPKSLVSASAVGYYGADRPEPTSEATSAGSDFLAQLCDGWEKASQPSSQSKLRVVNIRIGLVLGRNGGALLKMLPAFQASLGGKIASSRQWMPWIHLDDLVELFVAALLDERFQGAYNGVAPNPVTNQQFTRILGQSLGRPTPFPVPGLALKLLFGEAAEVLLGGQNVRPQRALDLGFNFRYSELSSCLSDLLSRDAVTIGQSEEKKAHYQLTTETIIDAPLDTVFAFFSKPQNLGAITPPNLSFAILNPPSAINQGTEIDYRIKLGPVPMSWRSLIDRWVPQEAFVDTQLKGPYSYWYHEHSFEARGQKTIMRDTVDYRLPLGPLGRVAHYFFVSSKLRDIFSYREYFARTRFRAQAQLDTSQ